MTDSFGARLRAQRERKRIGLTAIANDTKIKASLFDGLERDDVSGWPSGIFRRAFIRAYAEAIGLDPEPVVREFLERFPDPNDERPAQPAGRDPAAAATARDVNQDGSSELRLTLDDSGSRLASLRPKLAGDRSQRVSAAVCDVVMVLAAGVLTFAVFGRFWTPLAIAALTYYGVGVAVSGNSFGVWLIANRRGAMARRTLTAVPAPVVRHRDAAANVRPFEAREFDKAV